MNNAQKYLLVALSPIILAIFTGISFGEPIVGGIIGIVLWIVLLGRYFGK